MILLCLLSTALAVAWFIGPPAHWRSRIRDHADDRQRASGRAPVGWVAGACAVVLVGAAFGIGGARAVVITLAATIGCATAARLTWLNVAAARVRTARQQVAQACSVVASQVRVGRVPTDALMVAAVDCRVLQHASRVQGIGGDVVAALHAQSRLPGHRGLADLARAWQLSARTGAPMAEVLDRVAEALRRDLATQRTVAAELSGPRATGRVMAVLPVVGLGLGYLLGGDPIRFLSGGPFGWACLLLGVALAALGALWVDWLSRQAAEFR